MSLLHQIQESVIQEGGDLGSILLKLRFLASKLGSNVLEEWVRHESEGYPDVAEVPPYRIVSVSFKGTFTGRFGVRIQNAPIPPYIVEQHAGERWTKYEFRQSIAVLAELLKSSTETRSLQIDASNLIILLQGKIYEDYACNEIKGSFSLSELSGIQQAVRSRILELTLELEKSIPAAPLVSFGSQQPKDQDNKSGRVQQISQQIIYGNVANAVSGGQGSTISIAVQRGDTKSLVDYLTESGLPKDDAVEIANIMKAEEPISIDEPFGVKARDWITSNVWKAAKGAWGIGLSVATRMLSEAALKYYGFK